MVGLLSQCEPGLGGGLPDLAAGGGRLVPYSLVERRLVALFCRSS